MRVLPSDPRWPRLDALAWLLAILANPHMSLGEFLALCPPGRRAELLAEVERTRAAVAAEMKAEMDTGYVNID